jgi:metal-dependent amidase/aminoacylase/carboxypeptidase family protein
MISAKIIDGLQTNISRKVNLSQEGAVITIGKIESGIQSNIIPERTKMIGTVRTLDYDMQKIINDRMKEMVQAIAKAYRAKATIEIEKGYPITFNDPAFTKQMLPSLQAAAGKDQVTLIKAITGAEDFSFCHKDIPGLYLFLGGQVPNSEVFPHHTPGFMIDESGMLLGVKAFIQMSLDYLGN